MISQYARYYEAPGGLEDRIRFALRRERAEVNPWRILAIAAGVLLIVSLGWNISQFRSQQSDTEVAVLSAHLASLTGTHLLDVQSSDQHTVKPWFNGKLSFSPPVRFVEDFPLLGGRIDYIQGHEAAALVYGRAKHVINVEVWPLSGAGVSASASRNGYNIRSWQSDGMQFWATSDVNGAELDRFESQLRRN